ncbi:MAG: 6-bladed beta-propeller [Thermomicrobiales bacterium]
MDDSPFARWLRLFSRHLSRRRLGGLATGALGAFGIDTAVSAKKRRLGKKKRKKRCRGGTSRCGKTCVNTRTSATHCGGCNQGCSAAEVCLNGACSLYRFVTAWGSEGDGDEQFSSLNAIAVDGDGNVYGADTGNHRVQKFDNDGTFVTNWGSADDEQDPLGNDEFAFPQGIDIAPGGNVLVTDHNHFRVQTFDSVGTFVDTWPSQVGGIPFGPEAIAIDTAGNAFVVDRFPNNRIVKFDSNGDDVATLGGGGSGDGQFQTPEGVAVDAAGNVFVADAGNNRVQKFAPDGQNPNAYNHVATIGGAGDGDGEFNVPAAVEVDGDGNVFVADLGNDRVQKFAPNAQDPHQYEFVTAWGSPGSGNGEFFRPLDVAVDDDGNVFVADLDNSRIQKFAPVG